MAFQFVFPFLFVFGLVPLAFSEESEGPLKRFTLYTQREYVSPVTSTRTLVASNAIGDELLLVLYNPSTQQMTGALMTVDTKSAPNRVYYTVKTALENIGRAEDLRVFAIGLRDLESSALNYKTRSEALSKIRLRVLKKINSMGIGPSQIEARWLLHNLSAHFFLNLVTGDAELAIGPKWDIKKTYVRANLSQFKTMPTQEPPLCHVLLRQEWQKIGKAID